MNLYTYFRSSASYRVRIALHLKNLDFTSIPIHLLKEQQNSHDYLAKNPQGFVPIPTESKTCYNTNINNTSQNINGIFKRFQTAGTQAISTGQNLSTTCP